MPSFTADAESMMEWLSFMTEIPHINSTICPEGTSDKDVGAPDLDLFGACNNPLSGLVP